MNGGHGGTTTEDDHHDARRATAMLLSNYEHLDRLDRVLGEVLFQGIFACGSGARPAADLAARLSTMGATSRSTDRSEPAAERRSGAHCGHCEDMDVVAHVQANVAHLMSTLADHVIEISVPGVAARLDLDTILTSATAAMDAFALKPARASSHSRD